MFFYFLFPELNAFWTWVINGNRLLKLWLNRSKKTVIQLTNSAWMMCYTLAGILVHGLTLAQCNPTIKLVQHSWIPKQVTQLHKGQNNPLNHISMETQETF